MLWRFHPLRTIRAQMFVAFCAMSLLTGALGAYGIYAITTAGHIVADTYDRPLMAINFARSASVTFAQMENQLLQARLAGDPALSLAKVKTSSASFFDDLRVARQRSMSPGGAVAADQLRGLVQRWLAAVDAAVRDGHIDADAGEHLTVLSDEINEQFDRFIELTAEDGFRERQRSLGELGVTRGLSIGCTLLALSLAGLITVLLGRRIRRPLSVAVAVADRIAQGDFAAPIPDGDADEIGRLLRSMRSMQTSIRAMMDREAEERRSAQRRLGEAIEGSSEAMMLVDADGKIVIANSQMRQFVPVPSQALGPGASFVELVNRAVPEGTVWTPQGAHQEPAVALASAGEVRMRPDLWLRVSRSSTQDGGFFLFWSDISDIKEREARLIEAKQEAESASRAKSNFLATMSHELRTPLNAIIGFSEMIDGELFGSIGNPRYREYGGIILKSGRHLLAVISGVLDFAKVESGQAHLHSEPLDLAEIVQDCAQMVQDQCARGGLTLAIETAAEPAPLLGDAQKLRQMLLNLLSNAIKFTPPGGSVAIALKTDIPGWDGSGRPATSNSAAGRLRLSVRDSGIGMDPSDIPTALSPFGQIDSRLARRYEGTGLGLPLAKAFAEMHGAAFAIDSRLGEGTTVSVVFATPAASAVLDAAPIEAAA